MDFKSLINKINSLNDEVKTVAAPTIAPAVQLNEDAQLRVLSGRTTYVAEAKKKAEAAKKEEKKEVDEGFDADAKTGDTFKTAKGTATKTATGMKHTKDKYDYDPGSDDKDDKKRKETARKAKKESVDTDAFKGKFAKMVEAKKDPKNKKVKEDPNEGNEFSGALAKAKKAGDKEFTVGGKTHQVKEGAKPDFLDIDGDGDKKEPMKKAAADKGGDKKDGEKKGMSDKQAKYFGKKNESVSSDVKKASKKLVKESAEPKMSFKQMVQLVQESGGQQQIDPTDKELFNWATRVASSKLGEGMKAELYAGLIYERNGGVFEMYDVLSEDQK